MQSSDLLIFDLDGTLLDTAPDLAATLNHILQQEGLPHISTEHVHTLIGQGARAMLQKGFALHERQITDRQLDDLFEAFLQHYRQHIAEKTRPFPGLLDALTKLQTQGWISAICTNKLESLAQLLLKKLALQHLFVTVTGGDSFVHKKPHPVHLLKTIKQAGGIPARSIMIGDSQTDIDAAKAADVPVIAVDFGYSATPVKQFKPDLIISHFDELPKAVADIARQYSFKP